MLISKYILSHIIDIFIGFPEGLSDLQDPVLFCDGCFATIRYILQRMLCNFQVYSATDALRLSGIFCDGCLRLSGIFCDGGFMTIRYILRRMFCDYQVYSATDAL